VRILEIQATEVKPGDRMYEGEIVVTVHHEFDRFGNHKVMIARTPEKPWRKAFTVEIEVDPSPVPLIYTEWHSPGDLVRVIR
jgi:hypothetical protein